MTTALATAHRPVSAMVPFVCAVIGSDANEPLHHIIVRKEAERKAGSGEFWWGLSAPLGRDVEACANGVTLPALFSASNVAAQHGGQVRIWEEWESVLDPKKSGRIPSHVVVSSGYNAKKDPPHYALICHSNVQLTLGNLGNCDLTGCLTFKNKLKIKYIIGARLLVKQHPLITPKGTPSALVRRVAFEASLVGHCYVNLRSLDC
jgi:hypothetical protein